MLSRAIMDLVKIPFLTLNISKFSGLGYSQAPLQTCPSGAHFQAPRQLKIRSAILVVGLVI